MSVIPRSLFNTDGSLLIPTNKSSFMHYIDDVVAKSNVTPVINDLSCSTYRDLYLTDAMPIIQGIKKTPTMNAMTDFMYSFCNRIQNLLLPYIEGRIVFDRYLNESLKNPTCKKRATTEINFDVHPNMVLTMSIKDILSYSQTKRSLTELLGKELLDVFIQTHLEFKQS